MAFDFIKHAKKNEIAAGAAIGGIVLLVAYYFVFLHPLFGRMGYLFSETSRIQSDIKRSSVSIKNIPKLKEEINGLRSREESYSGMLPSEEEFPAVLENLSALARANGVKITKIMPLDKESFAGELKKSAVYTLQKINISAQCGYHQLGAFISELENSKRFIEVSDIRIDAGRANPKRHDAQLALDIFVLNSSESGKDAKAK